MADDPTPAAAQPAAPSPTTSDVTGGAPPPAPDPQALNAMIAEATAAAATTTDPTTGAATAAAPPSPADQEAIDELLRQASFDDASTASASAGNGNGAGAGSDAPGLIPPDTMPFDLPGFQQVMQDAQVSSIDLLRDVELNVKIELGRSRMLVEDVLKLAEGSVVELDKLAGDPVDVFVNDRLVARGEVLVLNDNFCVRVNEIVTGAKEEGQ